MHTIVIFAGRKVLKELRPKLAGSLKLSTYNRRKIWQKENEAHTGRTKTQLEGVQEK